VFISTPHRASFVAGNWIGRFMKKRVKQAKDLRHAFSSDKFPEELFEDKPTSVDSMTPDSLFVQILSGAPIEAP
jgi:hypothetical protein